MSIIAHNTTLATINKTHYMCPINSKNHNITNPNLDENFSELITSLQQFYETLQTNLGLKCNYFDLEHNVLIHIDTFYQIFCKKVQDIPSTKKHKLIAIKDIFAYYSKILCWIKMADSKKKQSNLGYMNQYTQYFNTQYNVTLPYVGTTNHHTKHSSIQRINTAMEKGMTPMMEHNMLDILGEDKNCRHINLGHDSRRHKCFLYVGDVISGFLDMFIKNKKFKVEFTDTIVISFHCTNDFPAIGMENAESQYICHQKVILYPLNRSKILMAENQKIRPWKQEEIDEWNLYWNNYIDMNSTVLIPNNIICKCPGNCMRFLIPSDMIRVSTCCIYCEMIYCRTCMVFQNHSNDNKMCNYEKYMRLKELGMDGTMKPCPNTKCPQLIEKSEGCNKMKCDMKVGGCGTTFCYVCGCKTAIQKDVLITIEEHMKSIERPVTINYDYFAYIHVNNECIEARGHGVFRTLHGIPEYVQTFIRYEGGEILSYDHFHHIMNMIHDIIDL
jgi:hypothetical protein